ncbi:MAG: iron-sulfur cluster assembly scaffold protein [Pseudomonadales bacterium]|nr:iron-sulfur cluster assembly scaffold protein [Pseudomonadales bacterium]
MNDIYHLDLLDEARNPNNFGDLETPDFVSTNYNASCGDVITVSVKLSKDKKKIQDIKWKGQGCVISQASMSVLSQRIIGSEIVKIQQLSQKEILQDLGLDKISVGRIKCLLLGLTAVRKLLNKLEAK